jgi:hypothetical protein
MLKGESAVVNSRNIAIYTRQRVNERYRPLTTVVRVRCSGGSEFDAENTKDNLPFSSHGFRTVCASQAVIGVNL